MDFSIRPVETIEEIEGIVNVQRMAWNMDDIGIVPLFETRAVADAGFVYIAVDKEERVIGFIYGYHHFPHWHYSHMMAVLPEWQGKNVGYELKRYHRKMAIQSEHFVEGIKWTVDPLLPNNAYLNFAKLGCTCDTYKINYYGDPDRDGVEIYAGVPTDRFLVIWPIHNERTNNRMQDYHKDRVNMEQLLGRSPVINRIENDTCIYIEDQLPNQFTVEVPSDYQSLRRNSLEIAKDWRMKFREICVEVFGKAWEVFDYHSIVDQGSRRNFYEFKKKAD